MLKRVVFVLAVLSGAAFAESSPPPQPTEQHQEASNGHAAAKSDEKKPAKSTGESLSVIWDKTWEDPVAFYTFVLTGFTGLLAFVSFFQGAMLLRSDRSARIAAEAADLSARAAIAVNLPIIRIVPAKVGYGSSGLQRHISVYSLQFSNLGATKAFPIEVEYGWTIGGELPPTPIYRRIKAFEVGDIFEPNPTVDREIYLPDAEIEIPETGYNQIQSGTINVWFYCRLLYLDFMETERTIGLCWKRFEHTGGGGFRADTTPAYNAKT